MTRTCNYPRLFAGLLLALAAGCSETRPDVQSTVPATGVVTYNGQPVEGALVSFVSENMRDGRLAWGETDKDGKFQLKTLMAAGRQADGALPGSYQVTIRKREAPPAAAGNAQANRSGPPAAASEAGESPKDEATTSDKESSDTAPSDAGPSDAEPSTAEPSAAEVSEKEPTEKKSSEAEPSEEQSSETQSKGPPTAPGGGPPSNAMRPMPQQDPGKSLIPERYERPETSGLTVEVNAGDEPFRFELTD